MKNENERLREALKHQQDALEIVRGCQNDGSGRCFVGINDLNQGIEQIRKALAAKPDVCVWTHDELGWHSGCPEGDWLSTIALSAIGFCAKDRLLDTMYCPGCGDRIEIK